MPYKDKGKQQEAQRRSMAKARGVKPVDVKPESVKPRINPRTGEPYKPRMLEILAYAPESIEEYERKHSRKPVLVISELPRAQVDYLYRGLMKGTKD